MRTRLSAYTGSTVSLNAQFLQGGVAKDPLAIRAIRIYRGSVCKANLVQEIILPTPDESSTEGEFPYDGALYRTRISEDIGPCGTEPNDEFIPGKFTHNLDLCADIYCPGVYYDVWCFIGCEEVALRRGCGDEDVTIADIDWDDESLWTCQCGKFYVSPCGWSMDDELYNLRLGFEPLDSRFQKPEVRTLEVGLMPLPLYDYNYQKIAPLIPMLEATIDIETQHCETIVFQDPMSTGLRQGSYRSNPYVLRYLVDTNKYLKGTYNYIVTVKLPNGETRSSPKFTLAIR